jgi:hypothetical protein
MAVTELEAQQRGLLALIKGRSAPAEDGYLAQVTGSRELAMVREIALWWRAFQLEVKCPFSSRLLKRLGRFEALVAAYFDNNATSPFVEELSRDFLALLGVDEDPLVRIVSVFEHALLETRDGSSVVFEVVWDRHPDRFFRALNQGGDIPSGETGRRYRMRIASDLPHVVTCTMESDLQPALAEL